VDKEQTSGSEVATDGKIIIASNNDERYSTVSEPGLVIKLQSGRPGIDIRKRKRFFLYSHIQTSSRTHPASCTAGLNDRYCVVER
jgi:hypothetical protein